MDGIRKRVRIGPYYRLHRLCLCFLHLFTCSAMRFLSSGGIKMSKFSQLLTFLSTFVEKSTFVLSKYRLFIYRETPTPSHQMAGICTRVRRYSLCTVCLCHLQPNLGQKEEQLVANWNDFLNNPKYFLRSTSTGPSF